MHCLELDTKCDDVEDRNIPKSEKNRLFGNEQKKIHFW